MNIHTLLPAASFVGFRTRKVLHPTLAWENRALGKFQSPVFCLPYEGEPDAMYGAEELEMLGERYGGEGVGHNGGGVRCGYADGMQVKGVGKNPLAGVDMHFWHSHGGCALELAIREAIWGEVCDFALPFGGARAHAIVSLGTQIPYGSHAGRRLATRALLYRQPKVRPAHFARSVFFAPSDAMRRQYVSDGERTRKAIEAFPAVMEQMGIAAGEPDDLLRELVRRSARQIAAARAKKILHGGLSPSNIGVDGAWLDYDTITTMSDYGPLIMGSFDMYHFLKEHEQLPPAFKELGFYLSKYSRAPLSPPAAVNRDFAHFFQEYLSLEFAKLTGVPEHVLAGVPAAGLERLYKTIEQIFSVENTRPFYYSPRHIWDMPERFGRYSVPAIMRRLSLAFGHDAAGIDTRLRDVLDNDALRQRLVDAVAPVFNAYREQYGTLEHPTQFLAANAQRINTPVHQLYRANLDSRIDALCAEGGDIQGFIDEVLRIPRFVLGEPEASGEVLLDAIGIAGGAVHPRAGFTVKVRRADPRVLAAALEETA